MGRWRRYYTKQAAWRRPRRYYSNKGRLSGGAKGKKPFNKSSYLGIDEAVREGGEIAYSDDNMRKICEGEVNILSYRDVMQCESLDDVLGEFGAAIILYETEPQYGHWVSLMSVGKGVVEFFDPYGKRPDSQLQYIPASMHCEPVLQELCDAAGAKLIWNEVPLQSETSHISTCGRWSSVRVAMRFMTLQQFQNFFTKQKLPPDSYVTMLTLFIR